jgi:hypothetical protein
MIALWKEEGSFPQGKSYCLYLTFIVSQKPETNLEAQEGEIQA